MDKIKQPSVSGSFYSADEKELISNINYFYQNNRQDYNLASRAIIVPHAGYYYSGQIASEGFQYLHRRVKNIFIFAPAHHMAFDGLAISSFDKWKTPLGEIEINQDYNKELKKDFGCNFNDEAFENEHSAEVQVPFVQAYYETVKIIPILIGRAIPEMVTKIITHYWNDTDNGFIISSDLSHFLAFQEARKIDGVTAQMIEMLEVSNFQYQQACGATGILGLVNFAKEKEFSLIRVDMKNSGDVSGDADSVVGYGSWFLYEGNKSEFIKKYFSDLIINVCKDSIEKGLGGKKLNLKDEKIHVPAVLEEYGACFVTLTYNKMLRGCIGSIIAHQPLIDDLVHNAYNAAFSDTRFYPLSREEFADLDISVSLLSSPERMSFNDEQDLLGQIVPFTDGIIIKDGNHQAVYLPSVWEQLPDKEEFLNSLKQKAGLNRNHFSYTFEAYKFSTVHIP